MMVLSWLELLVLAGYLESGLGFTGSNYEFVVELEFLTRGGKVPFILAMDANETYNPDVPGNVRPLH